MYQSLELFKTNAIQEGVKKGQRKEKVRILTLLLRNKLNSLSPEMVIKIKKSSTRKLEGLLKHLYEIESEKDILKYL